MSREQACPQHYVKRCRRGTDINFHFQESETYEAIGAFH